MHRPLLSLQQRIAPFHISTSTHYTHWITCSTSTAHYRTAQDNETRPFQPLSRPLPQQLKRDRRKSRAVHEQLNTKRMAAAVASKRDGDTEEANLEKKKKKTKKMPPSERKQMFALAMQQLRHCFRNATMEDASNEKLKLTSRSMKKHLRSDRERIEKRGVSHVESNSVMAWRVFQEKIVPQKLHIPLDDYYRFFEILAKDGLVSKCFTLYSHMKKFDHVQPDRNIHALLIHACAQGREESDVSGANAKYVQRAKQVLDRSCQEYETLRRELLKLDAESVRDVEETHETLTAKDNDEKNATSSSSSLPSNLNFHTGEEKEDPNHEDEYGMDEEYEDEYGEAEGDVEFSMDPHEAEEAGHNEKSERQHRTQTKTELTMGMRKKLTSSRPTTYMINEFLRTCLNAKDLHSALDAYDVHVRSHFVPESILEKERVFDKEEDDDDDNGEYIEKEGKSHGPKSSVFFRPDKITFSIVIQLMAAAGNSESCFSVLDDLKYYNNSVKKPEFQIRPDAFFYNTLLKACLIDVKRNDELDMELMFSIYRHMVQNEKVRPTIHTFNLLLQAAAAISTNVRKVGKLYRVFGDDHGEKEEEQDTLSETAEKKEQNLLQTSLVYRIYREMQAQNVQGDQYLLCFLVQLLSKDGHCHLAVKEIMEGQLAARFLTISKDTFAVVLKELFRHRIDLWKSEDYLNDKAFVFDPTLGPSHQMTTVDQDGQTVVKQLSKKQFAARTFFQYYVRPVLQLMLQQGEVVDIDLMNAIARIVLHFTTTSYGKSNMKFDVELLFCFVDYCHSRFSREGNGVLFRFPRDMYERLKSTFASSKSEATHIRINAMEAFVTREARDRHINGTTRVGRDNAISIIQSANMENKDEHDWNGENNRREHEVRRHKRSHGQNDGRRHYQDQREKSHNLSHGQNDRRRYNQDQRERPRRPTRELMEERQYRRQKREVNNYDQIDQGYQEGYSRNRYDREGQSYRQDKLGHQTRRDSQRQGPRQHDYDKRQPRQHRHEGRRGQKRST